MLIKKFTFTFAGSRAEEVAEQFKAYFWDGGLDQIIEQGLLESFELDLDDVKMEEEGVVINTNNKTLNPKI